MNLTPATLALALALPALAAPASAQNPPPTPSPSPANTPAPGTATSGASAAVTPGVPATAPVVAAPASTTAPEAYKYRFVPAQPAHAAPGTPQILAVYINDETLHSQGPISIKVQTSPDVVKVVNRNEGREYPIPLIAPGDFETVSKLPKVPFIAAGMTVKLEFVATGPGGTTTTIRVPVKVQ